MEQTGEFRNKPMYILSNTCNKGPKIIEYGKNGLFNKWYWKIGQPYVKKKKTLKKSTPNSLTM